MLSLVFAVTAFSTTVAEAKQNYEDETILTVSYHRR